VCNGAHSTQHDDLTDSFSEPIAKFSIALQRDTSELEMKEKAEAKAKKTRGPQILLKFIAFLLISIEWSRVSECASLFRWRDFKLHRDALWEKGKA
jgi:hypothetical protein